MLGEPKTPESTQYERGSDDEKRAAGKPLVRKGLRVMQGLWDGFALERDDDRGDTHCYLK